MSYSVFRIQGIKITTGLTGLKKHNKDRVSNTNADIDKTKSKDNITLVECNTYSDKFNEIVKPMKEEHIERMKNMRADRVRTFEQHINSSKNDIACEMIFTSDNDFFKNMNKHEIKKWAETSLDFVTNDLGIDKKNVLHAVVHMDEKTPHLHVVAVPLVKFFNKKQNKDVWSISRRQYISGKQQLSELQDIYNKRMNENGYKLERGEKGSDKKHTTKLEYTQHKFKELSKDINHLEASKNGLEGKLELLNIETKERVIEFDRSTNILNENSLVMYEIKEMKTEPVMFSNDKVKIDKKDLEKLKDSALKAYTQHNLYATVIDKLKKTEESKEYCRKELDESRKHAVKEYNYLKSEISDLKNENKDLKNIISKSNEIIWSMDKEFLDEFFKVKKELEKSKETNQKNSQIKSKKFSLER